MRPISNFTLHATLAIALAALAATTAAAGPAFLKLGTATGDTSAKDPHGGQIEVESWSWGSTGSGADLGSWAKADGLDVAPSADSDMVMKGQKISQNAPAPRRYVPGNTKYSNVKLARSGSSARPAEKRQHGWATVSKPLDRGAVMVKGKLPGCTVGAAYPDAVLLTAEARYELSDLVISGCAMDSVSLNYAKVRVRGWDPEKKEE